MADPPPSFDPRFLLYTNIFEHKVKNGGRSEGGGGGGPS